MEEQVPEDGAGWTELALGVLRGEARLARLRDERHPQAPALEALLASQHGRLRAPAVRRFGWWWELHRGLPAALRESRRQLWVATLAFCLGGLLGWQMVALDPAAAAWLLPADDLAEVARRLEDGQFWMEEPQLASAPARVAGLFVHNAQLALLVSGLGVLLGVGTVTLLVHNGVVFGALAGLVAGKGQASVLVSFLAPHGVLELPAIAIAGTAGLVLAEAVWSSEPRRHLEQVAGRVVRLTLLAVVLLAWAAVVEGALSPLPWPRWAAALLALGNGALFALWLRR